MGQEAISASRTGFFCLTDSWHPRILLLSVDSCTLTAPSFEVPLPQGSDSGLSVRQPRSRDVYPAPRVDRDQLDYLVTGRALKGPQAGLFDVLERLKGLSALS
jgi:hypothetical protein